MNDQGVYGFASSQRFACALLRTHHQLPKTDGLTFRVKAFWDAVFRASLRRATHPAPRAEVQSWHFARNVKHWTRSAARASLSRRCFV